MMEKNEIRRRIRKSLLEMPPEERESASEKIADHVFQLDSWRRARVIMAYMSLPTEPSTKEILQEAERLSKTILLPKCGKKPEMEALPWRGMEWMVPGPYGILEPVSEESADVSFIPEPDLVLVPCVAATRDGLRLGHGAGYYDWFLRRHPAETVCLCFEQQLMDTLPSDPWDVPMDRVIWG